MRSLFIVRSFDRVATKRMYPWRFNPRSKMDQNPRVASATSDLFGLRPIAKRKGYAFPAECNIRCAAMPPHRVFAANSHAVYGVVSRYKYSRAIYRPLNSGGLSQSEQER